MVPRAALAAVGLGAAVFVIASTWLGPPVASLFGSRAAAFAPQHPDAIPAPNPYKLASIDGDAQLVGLEFDPTGQSPLVFPQVDRSAKGDLLAARPHVGDQEGRSAAHPLPPELEAALRSPPIADDAIRPLGQTHRADHGIRPEVPGSARPSIDRGGPDLSILDAATDFKNLGRHLARLYFDAKPADAPIAVLRRWARGEEPVSTTPYRRVDGDLKHFALADGPAPTDHLSAESGVSVASKGEVTGEGRRPRSPAERLGLDPKARAKAEKCLANAIYFEARGEQLRGQIAVAQVVMNRVFSGYYPSDVCGVVYQNASRHLACQFTFACDGRSKIVREPDAYLRAKRIARETLDGRLWLSDVGKATHYHAYWVHPRWVREMHRLDRIGVHTFYRPRVWGNGADAPSWGSTQQTAAVARAL
jgi:spore germination cell wall hydrolase CwlJ-like protein